MHLVLGMLLLAGSAFAETRLQVNRSQVPGYSKPDSKSAVLLRLPQGTQVEAIGPAEGGFYRLKTKSGKEVWIAAEDVRPTSEGISPDDVVVESPRTKSDRFTLDLGGQTSTSSAGTAVEIQAGLNYFVNRWLVWRNAPFFRFASNVNSMFGLDTSLRAQLQLPGEDISPRLHAGVGYRFINTGSHAPFIEGGLGARLGGIFVQGNVKWVLGSLIRPVPNDLIWGVAFSGGIRF